jgi:hypothetical protein
MLLWMQFVHDLDAMARMRLAQHGYQDRDNDSAMRRFALLCTHTERLIPEQKYTVHISRELSQRQLANDNRRALDEIKQRLEDGLSLRPYLSRRVQAPETVDGLFLSWGILHLHLNPIATQDEDGFVSRKRGGKTVLLMLRIQQNQAYLIDIEFHSDPNLFVNTRFLEIVDRNWPELHMAPNGITGHQLSPEQIRALRSKNANYSIALENRTIFTNIMSAAGIPMEIQYQYDALCIELENVERDVRRRFYEYFPFSLSATPTRPWIQRVKLVGIEDDFFILRNQTTQRECWARRAHANR